VSRRAAAAIVLGAVALAAVLALLWFLGREPGAGGPEGPGEQEGAGRLVTFELYFPGEGGYLYPEQRELAAPADPRGRARAIVLAVLGGPTTSGLHAPFPRGVGLLDLYLAADGTAYVDLGDEERPDPPSGGSLAEMMMVYSLVDSLAFNLPEVERVSLLWNGLQRESFSGHLDTSAPLLPAEDLLAEAARRRPKAGG
jgi:hypothetical protein